MFAVVTTKQKDLLWFYIFSPAELNDQEANNQSEATRLAAQEIQKLVEEKENLAKYLQQQVTCVFPRLILNHLLIKCCCKI